MAVHLQDIPQQARWNEIRAALQANLNALNQAIESGTNAEGKPLATVEYVNGKDSILRSDITTGALTSYIAATAVADNQGNIIAEHYATKQELSWQNT
jgi:hypothetical protein